MKLIVRVESELELIHVSGQTFTVDDNIVKEYDENSEKYKTICKAYEKVIGFTRENNKDEFDKKLLKLVCDEMKQQQKSSIENCIDIVKQVYKNPNVMNGYIQMNGSVIKVKDFSMVRIKRFDARITKK